MSSLPQISPELLQKYQSEISRLHAPATSRRKISSLRHFFDWAISAGHLESNPLQAVLVQTPGKQGLDIRDERIDKEISTPNLQPLTSIHWLKASLFTLSGLAVIALATYLWQNLPTGGRSKFVALSGFAQQLIGGQEPGSSTPENTPSPSPTSQISPTSPPSVETDELTARVLNLIGEVPLIKALGGPLSIDTQELTLKTSTGSDGNITLAPDGEGQVLIHSSTTEQDSFKITNANLTTGNLITGYVGNNTSNYNLLYLSSGSTPTERFSVDAQGNTYIGGTLQTNGQVTAPSVNTQQLTVAKDIDLTGNLKIGNVTRINSAGRLASITGYYQDSGLFKIDQGSPDTVTINKTPTTAQGSASADSVTFTLDETNVTSSAYDTLVLNRVGGTSSAYALDVRSGNANFAGDINIAGSSITTSSSTFNLINSTATTVNFARGATNLSIGASSGTTTINNALAVTGSASLSSTLSVTGASTFTGNLTVNGRPTFTKVPSSAHTGTWAIDSSNWNVSDATIYINPASATSDSNLIGAAVGGNVKFAVDAEGDIFAHNMNLTGTTTLATTDVTGDLTVEGNTTLGDATTDTLSIAPTTLSFTKENAHTIQIANSTSTNTAGSALTILGAAGVGSGNGGAISVTGGAGATSSGTGNGGAISLTTGAGGSTSGTSGALALATGTAASGASTGTITIDTGTATGGGTTGAISIGTGSAAKTITIGNATGATALNFTSGTGAQTFTSSVVSGTTTTSAFVFTDAALTTGTLSYLTSSSITTGKLLDIADTGNAWTGNGTTNGLVNLASSSTAGIVSSSSILLNIARSGANANASHTAYGVSSSVTDTGTTNTNIAGYFSASGATNNYAIIVPSGGGRVGIGTTSPAATLDIANPATSGGLTSLLVTPGAHTAVTAEVIDISVPAHTMTITGAYATQRFINIGQPTISAASALAVTTAIAMRIAAAPTQTASAQINSSIGLSINDGTGVTITNVAGSTYQAYTMSAHTITLSTTTQMTGTVGIAASGMGQITIAQSGGAVTVNNAMGLHVRQPTLGASVTVTTLSGIQIADVNSTFNGSAGFNYSGINILAHTITDATTTQVTSSPGVAGVRIGTITVNQSAGAVTINSAAALYIAAAPAAGTSVTITNPYAIWVAGGNSLFSGTLTISPAVDTSGVPPGSLTITPGAHTGVTSAAIVLAVNAATTTITGGYSLHRHMNIAQPTITAATAQTITTAASLHLNGPPTVTGSAVITNDYGIRLGTAVTIAGAASTTMDMIGVLAGTVTTNTTTQITSTVAVTGLNIGQITVAQSAGAVTVNNVASLYIAGALVAGTSVTLTNNYALWIDAGTSRFDGNISFGAEANYTVSVLASTTAATAGGNLTIASGAGSTSGAGGTFALNGGAGGATGAGGAISLTTGAGGSTSGTSGALALATGTAASGQNTAAVSILSGNAGGAGNSGAISMLSGTTATGSSGTISIVSGNASGAGTSGNVVIDAGSVVAGTLGAISIGKTNAGSVTLGNASGTFAVASTKFAVATTGITTVNFNGTATTNGVCHSGTNIDTATDANRDLVACSSAPNDIAEWYETTSPGVEAGDILATSDQIFTYQETQSNPFTGEIFPGKIQRRLSKLEKTNRAYQGNILGVVSTSPAQVVGADIRDQGQNPRPIALAGRVPVKVSSENGSISAGDPLTVSSIPGVAMKATKAGKVIGQALEDYDGLGINKILVYVNPSWYDPDVYLTSTGELHITKSTDYGLQTTVDGRLSTVDRVGAFADAIIARVEAGIITTQELIAKTIKTDNIEIAQKLISPVIEADHIQTKTLDVTSDATVSGELTATKSKFGDLLANDATISGTLIANSLISNSLISQDATISGTLYADKIKANEIEGLSATIQELTASTAATQTLAFQQAQNANQDIVSRIQDRLSKLSETLASINPSAPLAASNSLTQLLNNSATSSATLAFEAGHWDSSAPASNASNIPTSLDLTGSLNVLADLNVYGTTRLSNTFVKGQVIVNSDSDSSTLSLTSNTLAVFGNQLNLLASDGINLMSGSLVVGIDGNVVIANDLRIGGVLHASRFAPLAGNDFTIALNSEQDPRFKIQDSATGETVASIDASGSAKIRQVVIASSDATASSQVSGDITTNSTAGKAILAAGATSMTIYNPNVTDTTLVYLTPITSTGNQVVYVRNKVAREYFTVAVDRPVFQDIEFNWWIIKLEASN